jgi:hypothetical protein
MNKFLMIFKIKVSAYAESSDLIFKTLDQINHLVTQSLKCGKRQWFPVVDHGNAHVGVVQVEVVRHGPHHNQPDGQVYDLANKQ